MRTIILGVAAAVLLAASQVQADERAAIQDDIAKLNWHFGPGSQSLSTSKVVVKIERNEAFLEGANAHEFMRLSEGHSAFKPDAIVLKLDGPLADSAFQFQYHETGHIDMDDWDREVDSAEILIAVRENTEQQNKQRAIGYPKLYVDGWLQRPLLDRQSAVVYWAFNGHNDQGASFVNAKAMKLGRTGMSVLTWVGSPDQFTTATQILKPALAAYDYQHGFRYADYRPGVDALAVAGIGAVTYKMITGSSRKGAAAMGAGLTALIVAFAKKLWLLIALPFVLIWKLLKRRPIKQQG